MNDTNFAVQVGEVHKRLSGVLEPTPLQYNQYLSDLHGANIWLKREDLSPVRSYKIRGAYTFLMDALERNPEQKLFVCASAGNHAQGFAHACRNFKRKGVIFMPQTTPQQKVMKTSSFGAPYVEIRLVGDGFDAANASALQFCASEGGLMVPPFDHPQIMLGQATVGKEIAEQLPEGAEVDRMIMPVGGGGLSSGVTQYLEASGFECDFTFVEPDLAPSLHDSLKAGERIMLDQVDNFVDGAAVAQIGENNFEQLRKYEPEDVLLAPTDGVCGTMIEMLNVEGVVLEPAGALAIDALKRLPKEAVAGKTIICIASGGNFDFERLPEVKERSLRFSGLKKYYILQFPQRPGALRDFLMILGPEDDIARFEYLKKSARNFGTVLIGIETTKAENFDILTGKMDAQGMRWQDITDNQILSGFLI
ncbi:MAG: threonine ammonia-lyase IlvA [Rhizobiaceae bacterium]|nr:threonine ammonia-lyase IlvA [Rhizobiaceae bacterium]